MFLFCEDITHVECVCPDNSVRCCCFFFCPSTRPLPSSQRGPCVPQNLGPGFTPACPHVTHGVKGAGYPGTCKRWSSEGRVSVGGSLPGSQRRGDARDDQEAVRPVRGKAAGGAAEAQRREGGSAGAYVTAAQDAAGSLGFAIAAEAYLAGLLLAGESVDSNTGEGQVVYSFASLPLFPPPSL